MDFLLYLVLLTYLTLPNTSGVAGSCEITKSPKPHLYKLAGDSFTLQWSVRFTIIAGRVQFLRLKTPSSSDAICLIALNSGDNATCGAITDERFKRIQWTGQLSNNIASFSFKNVTRALSLNYSLGFFRCDSDGKSTVLLEIVDRPKFNESRKKMQVREGTELSAACTTIAVPPMDVKWLNSRNQTLSQGTRISTLIIPSVNRKDSGRYVCMATNEVANITRNLFVHVVYPATISDLSSTNESFINKETSLVCHAEGEPSPTYHWITPSSQPGIASDKPNILRVLFKSSRDFGNYTCVVNNSHGVDRRTVAIKQLFRPGKVGSVVNHTEANMVELTWTIPHDNGGSEILDYLVTVYYGGGKKVSSNVTSTQHNITELVKNTRYTICIQARNVVGLGKEVCLNTTTFWEGAPGRPDQPRVSSDNEGNVNVSWNSAGDDVTSYIVKYRLADTEEWTNKSSNNPKDLMCTVSGLEQGKRYEIVIIAVNKHGESQPSPPNHVNIIPRPTTTARPTTPRTYTETKLSTSNNSPGPIGVNDDDSSIKTIIAIISVLLVLLIIVAVVFFFLWMRRRSGRNNRESRRLDHIPGPLNQDLYATVNKESKTRKKDKDNGDLVYAELSELAPTANEYKPSSYEPTDYADIAHILNPNPEPLYSNVDRRNSEGPYANIEELEV